MQYHEATLVTLRTPLRVAFWAGGAVFAYPHAQSAAVPRSTTLASTSSRTGDVTL